MCEMPCPGQAIRRRQSNFNARYYDPLPDNRDCGANGIDHGNRSLRNIAGYLVAYALPVLRKNPQLEADAGVGEG